MYQTYTTYTHHRSHPTSPNIPHSHPPTPCLLNLNTPYIHIKLHSVNIQHAPHPLSPHYQKSYILTLLHSNLYSHTWMTGSSYWNTRYNARKTLKFVIQQVNKLGNLTLSEPFSPTRQKGNGIWIAQISAMHRSPCRMNEGACALTIWQSLCKFPAVVFPMVRKSIQVACVYCIGVRTVIFAQYYFTSSFLYFL